jgi:hypothetical protein
MCAVMFDVGVADPQMACFLAGHWAPQRPPKRHKTVESPASLTADSPAGPFLQT